MRRILDPAQIESFAREIPRIRLPDPTVFAARGQRLHALSEGHPLEGYLRLMALLCAAQQQALDSHRGTPLPASLLSAATQAVPGMPLLPAMGTQREVLWRDVLQELCTAVAEAPHFPERVKETVRHLTEVPTEELERQVEEVLGAGDGVEPQSAPFLMAALQVQWVLRVSQLPVKLFSRLETGTVCPICGTAPVASIVHADKDYDGYRYLSCGLCATEWHMVRVKCSHCQSTAGIHYQSIENGPAGIRAEVCEQCRTYRKIFYHEHALTAEAVADDLASIGLDLLLTEAGFHRASGNPLLWQPGAG